MNLPKLDKKYIPWIFLLLLALGLRLVGLSKSIWMDEAFTLQEVFSQNFLQAVRSSDHLMLYPLLVRGWSFFGTGEAFLRLPSVLFGTATVLLLMLTLDLKDRRAAVLVGLMAAFSPSNT